MPFPNRLTRRHKTALMRAAAATLGAFLLGIATPPFARFVDGTKQAGLDFVHFNGMSGELYFVEMTGAGGALFDYDNDGDLDLYLVQGSMLGPEKTIADATFPPRDTEPMDRLYRNDLRRGPDGSRQAHFVDVTAPSGLRLTAYGMGVATGDIDNDGWTDLYVTQFGENRLMRNNGNGTFTDVTMPSGTGGGHAWSTSAVFFDFDRDGLQDLYVANYVEYSIEANKRCYAPSSRRDYCGPSAFKPEHDRLYRNLGGGRFEEVSDRLLAGYRAGPGLGVIAGDFDGDGWLDLYVANDGSTNQLWLNQKGKRFVNEALFAGVAVNRSGAAEASMGLDAADFDNDGDEDIFVTHLMGETNTLYVNDGHAQFEDLTASRGLAGPSFPYTAFGTGWIDANNDGWLDLMVFNGAVLLIPGLADSGDPYPLHQPNQLFMNQAGKRFVEAPYPPGSPLRLSEVSRGAAFGDVDNDGDTDAIVFNNAGRARLLVNEPETRASWLGLILRDRHGSPAVGAEVTIMPQGKPTLHRRARSDGSYCSANDPRVLVGLGDAASTLKVLIAWPDGTSTTIDDPPEGRYLEVRQGTTTTPLWSSP